MAPPVEVIVTAAVSDVAEVAPAPEASSKSSVVEPTSVAQIDAAPSAELVEGACSAVSRACHWQCNVTVFKLDDSSSIQRPTAVTALPCY